MFASSHLQTLPMRKKPNLLIHLLAAAASAISLSTSAQALSVKDLGNVQKNQPSIAERVAEESTSPLAVDRQQNRQQAEDYYSQGLMLQRQGKLDEAIAAYQAALRLNPRLAPVYLNLGAALAKQGKLEDAIAAYQTAIEINPKLAAAHYNLGNALAQKGQLDAAIAAYQAALQINPNYAKVYYNLGNVLAQQGKREEAIAQWREAVRINPDFAEAHVNLGINLSRQGERKEAVEAFKKARDLFNAQGKTQEATRVEQMLNRIQHPRIVIV